MSLNLCQEALTIAARYDTLRLHTYRDCELLHSRIATQMHGNSTLLRFDDVGYFNRIYVGDSSILSRLAEAERFYAGCPFACELVAADVELSAECASVCQARGWTPGKAYSWLAAPVERLIAPPAPSEFTIRETTLGEEERFLTTYLSAFEAEKDRFPAAIRNMRHLFQQDSITFLLATLDEVPVGIGMTYIDGDAMFFCAGATMPEFRTRGCHHALLAARVQLARARNVRYVYSWAAAGGLSERNMNQAGLEVVGTATAWLHATA